MTTDQNNNEVTQETESFFSRYMPLVKDFSKGAFFGLPATALALVGEFEMADSYIHTLAVGIPLLSGIYSVIEGKSKNSNLEDKLNQAYEAVVLLSNQTNQVRIHATKTARLKLQEESQQLFEDMVKDFYNQHPYKKEHATMVENLCRNFGTEYKLSNKELEALCTAARVCDYGESKVSKNVLNKQRRLNQQERDEIQSHVKHSLRYLKRAGYDKKQPLVINIVKDHHEDYDGSGYPRGKLGYESHDRIQISRLAMMLHIVDGYVGLTYDRPHRKGLSHKSALQMLGLEAGSKYDPQILRDFGRLCFGDERMGYEEPKDLTDIRETQRMNQIGEKPIIGKTETIRYVDFVDEAPAQLE